jgi:hypothetical protein
VGGDLVDPHDRLAARIVAGDHPPHREGHGSHPPLQEVGHDRPGEVGAVGLEAGVVGVAQTAIRVREEVPLHVVPSTSTNALKIQLWTALIAMLALKDLQLTARFVRPTAIRRAIALVGGGHRNVLRTSEYSRS